MLRLVRLITSSKFSVTPWPWPGNELLDNTLVVQSTISMHIPTCLPSISILQYKTRLGEINEAHVGIDHAP